MSTFTHNFKGMTLRDWFAGQALTGLLANGIADRTNNHMQDGPHDDRVDDTETRMSITTISVANSAYLFADAMLEARSNP